MSIVYKGKTRFYLKPCDYCGIIYEGQGAFYCGYSCSRKAKPIRLVGDANPSKRLEVRKKISDAKKGIPPSANTIAAVVKAHMGFYGKEAKNGRWIEDRTQLKDDSKDRKGQLHKEWSKTVKERDGWKCKIKDLFCSGRLESHHILSWSKYPNLRYEVNNGITLCHFHHPRKRNDEIKLFPYFSELVGVEVN